MRGPRRPRCGAISTAWRGRGWRSGRVLDGPDHAAEACEAPDLARWLRHRGVGVRLPTRDVETHPVARVRVARLAGAAVVDGLSPARAHGDPAPAAHDQNPRTAGPTWTTAHSHTPSGAAQSRRCR